jgi:hypothetical protein
MSFHSILKACAIFAVSSVPLVAGSAYAVTITFDNLITGQTSYSFDPDGDGIPDAFFSTTDPSGFRTVGPGMSQKYINEPGLEGTSLLAPDLRVEFPNKAKDKVSFGFALDSTSALGGSATFTLYDVANTQLASLTVPGATFTLPGGGTSSFPEGELALAFPGEAAYGFFDFDTQFGRYIIDNFNGNYGSRSTTQVPAPLPALGVTVFFGSIRRLRHLSTHLNAISKN